MDLYPTDPYPRGNSLRIRIMMILRIKSGKHRRSENTEEMNNGYWKLLKTEETKVDSDEWLKLPKDKQVEHRLEVFAFSS